MLAFAASLITEMTAVFEGNVTCHMSHEAISMRRQKKITIYILYIIYI